MTGRVGSWTYMAPEVVLNQPYNQSVDTFSFGVVLYEVLARTVVLGVSPRGLPAVQQAQHFAAGKLAAQMWACQVAAGARPMLPALWPQPLVQLVEACWHQVGPGEEAPTHFVALLHKGVVFLLRLIKMILAHFLRHVLHYHLDSRQNIRSILLHV